MTVYVKEFVCRRCGTHFCLRARHAYYCHPCARKHTSEVVMQKRAAKNPQVALGVGSGGNQWGRNNHCYKDGQSAYRRNFERANPRHLYCEICSGTQNLVVHHVDQNRKNSRLENLMALCRSCHAKAHGVAANLGEVPLVQKYDMPIAAEATAGADFTELQDLEA